MISNDTNLLSALIGNTSTVRNQLAQTQEQIASGRVSDTYSGLGNQAQLSLNLAPQIAHENTWSSNIDAATSRLGVTQTALTSIASIASNFFAQVNTLSQGDPTAVSTIAQAAKTALQQVGDLLNTKSGDIYVVAGQDTSNAPVPNTDPSVTGAALLASTTSTAPFSSTIGTAVPKIEVGQSQSVQVGVLANANTLAASAGTTTGSYMRDTMTALAQLASLSSSSSSSTVTTAATTARGYLTSAISAMGAEAGSLGEIQSSLTSRQTSLQAMSTTLQTQLASVQEVDMAATITKASQLQTQLQASYQIIAQVKNLSLANYL
jgi:flagellar hook-associated protein 3 FlgL